MIKDTISMILTAKELAVFVEKKIEALEKGRVIEKEKAEQFDAKMTCAYHWSNTALDLDYYYIISMIKEQTFLKLLQKFPENKHELFLDDLEYYRILKTNTEVLPNVGR